jgi:cytochrome c-type biogenesis protein CcmH
LPGAPKQAAQQIAENPEAVVEARGELVEEKLGQPKDRYLVIADGFARNGQYANAASVLLGAVEDNPKNFEAWLAMGNALLAHSEGFLTPAAIHAYEKAAEADPEHPGPAFFLGLGLAQSGRFAEARKTWADLLERSAEDAPWREDLEFRLQRLDMLIASQSGAAPAQ